MGKNQKRYHEYNEKYPHFIFHGYSVKDVGSSLRVEYDFSIPGLAVFRPHWLFPKSRSHHLDWDCETLDELFFSLGMVELISYWKTVCPPLVKISCRQLSPEAIAWWVKFYRKGLGEFFYVNRLTPASDFLTIECDEAAAPMKKEDNGGGKDSVVTKSNNHVLIPIGGGKDSVVTLHLLQNKTTPYCYMINPRQAALDTVAAANIPTENIITTTRTLDPRLLTLNREGVFNGHTPFSAIVAFSSVIIAFLHGISDIALSNEASANEPTVADTDINHQYSKSYEFESDFIAYESRYIASGVRYFSFLRPLSELTIAKIFAKLIKYHPLFQSCNVGSKSNIWCTSCSKCLFVYIILSPFLVDNELTAIFGRNLLDDDDALKDTFAELIGLCFVKPFECVGSLAEVRAALFEYIRHREANGLPLPKLVNFFKQVHFSDDEASLGFAAICRGYNEENHLPPQFTEILKEYIEDFCLDRIVE
ncbi:MAG: hypothetical protein LBC96_07010 [Lachnospiraceae bacterium]|jgi:hypothetical protein|nr:hypothetical protein [Lachnospiraceae bacterium]